MSHITTEKLSYKITDEAKLRQILQAVTGQYPGMQVETRNNGKTIMVRYAPIETYSRWKNGNLRFEKQDTGTWEMKGDGYTCREKYEEIKNAISQQYVATDALSGLTHMGYMVTQQKLGGKVVLRAVRY